MMLVYLVRQFTFDQVNHIAESKNPGKATKLDPNIARNLGIGNSTGLGMAPFIVNHPTLLHNWIYCREKALKEIRSIEKVNDSDFNIFKNCLTKSQSSINSWLTDSKFQISKINSLKSDLIKFNQYIEKECSIKKKYLWNIIYTWIEKNLGEECIEYIVSMMMEPYDNIIDPLINYMSSEEEKYFNIPAHRKISELKTILENNYKSIIKIDFNKKTVAILIFGLYQKIKRNPELLIGMKSMDAELEQPLAIARDIKKLYEKVIKTKQSNTIAEFLLSNDDVRHVVRRAFIVETVSIF